MKAGGNTAQLALSLEVMRILLHNHMVVIEDMMKAAKKHKRPYSEILKIDFSDPAEFAKMTKALPPTTLTHVVKATLALLQVQADVENFMRLDATRAAALRKKLKLVVRDLDRVLKDIS